MSGNQVLENFIGNWICACKTDPVEALLKGQVTRCHFCGCTNCDCVKGHVAVIALILSKLFEITKNRHKVVDAESSTATMKRYMCKDCKVHVYSQSTTVPDNYFVDPTRCTNGGSASPTFLVMTGSLGNNEECDDGNLNDNDDCTNACTLPICGDGIIWDEQLGNETCDDGGYCSGDGLTVCSSDGDCLVAGGTCEISENDGCDLNCTIEDRLKVAVVMSDGYANVQCSEQNTGSSSGDAIAAACDAYEDYDIRVHAVGFGTNTDESTLQSIAACGNGTYYYSSVTELSEIYKEISEDIIDAIFYEQTLIVTGDIYSRLNPYSYIEFDYQEPAVPYGTITTVETDFINDSYGSFTVPENSTIIDARVVSYSGPLWTDYLEINNTAIYNLTEYGEDYLTLGDPYPINIPVSQIGLSNLVYMTTALSPENRSTASASNKIILTLASNFSSYSTLSGISDGCNWHLEFEDNIFLDSTIPSDYLGSEECYYVSSGQNVSNTQDAMQVSVMNLLESLDYDSDGLIDVKFSDQNLKISSSELSGIPYDWSTEVQIRTWL